MKTYIVKIWGEKKFIETDWFFTFMFQSKSTNQKYLRNKAYQLFAELAGILRWNSKNIKLTVEPDILE